MPVCVIHNRRKIWIAIVKLIPVWKILLIKAIYLNPFLLIIILMNISSGLHPFYVRVVSYLNTRQSLRRVQEVRNWIMLNGSACIPLLVWWIMIQDKNGFQTIPHLIDNGQSEEMKASFLVVEILSVYNGNRHDDTCISEVKNSR